MSKPTRIPVSFVDAMGKMMFHRDPQECYESNECLGCGASVDYDSLPDDDNGVNRQQIYLDAVLCEKCQKGAESHAQSME